jgi:hypothetical protein
MKAMMIASLIILLFSSISWGGESYRDQVKAQLALIKLAGNSEGWEETHNDKFDKLDNGESDSFSFNLQRGKSYKIISVCDNDCSDLDLILYDENNNEINRDNSDDSTPMVEVRPKWTGQFSLKVSMYSCESNPCYYAICILGKGSNGANSY